MQMEKNVKTPIKFKTKHKPTHMFLNNRKLARIPEGNYPHLTTIYLQENRIQVIERLESAVNLTHLYLQNNQIAKIGNLNCLVNLKKLHLGGNNLSVIENLEGLQKLEELHVERQKIDGGDCLCFDPRTLLALADTLEILNVSHNRMLTLSSLSLLKQLRVINAGFNKLKDLNQLCEIVANWYCLESAIFTGNPVVKERLYAEKIIQHTYHMGSLDGKKVTKNTRNFIQLLEKNKLVRESKMSVNLTRVISDLPKDYPLALEKEISKSLMSGDGLAQPRVSKVSLAWTSVPKKRSHCGPEPLRIRPQSLPRDFQLFTHWLQ